MRANVSGLALIANVFYLFRSDPKAAPSRLVKLLNLLIDAKEQELKDRVRANKMLCRRAQGSVVNDARREPLDYSGIKGPQ